MQLHKNYYYLLRCVDELNNELKNKKIFEAFTQEKERLYLHIPHSDHQDYHLIISTDQRLSLIYQKETHYKAKKNVISFFQNNLPDKITEFSIALHDRIIRITMKNSSIYFMIRGSKSNVFLIDKSGKVESFKKIKNANDEKTIKEELENKNYISSLDAYSLDLKDLDITKISKQIPSISKEIINELSLRKYSINNLPELLNEIMHSKISVFYSDELHEPVLMPQTFKQINIPDSAKLFDIYLDSIGYYLSILYKTSGRDLLLNQLQKHVKKELEKCSNKLNNLKVRIEEGSKEEQYHKIGNLLLSNISQLKKGMSEIILDDYESGKKIKAKLDPKLSPNKNVDNHFNKARAEKINYVKSIELYKLSQKTFEKLTEYDHILNSNPSFDKLEELKKTFKIGSQSRMGKKHEENFNFRHFVIADKYHLYVGKDSKNNDLLTTRFAKQNDYWFHARGSAGSHAVLRVDNPKEGIPKPVIKTAAAVAAYYSKSKTSSLAPVSYTLKKFVRKRKDLDPGQVILAKEDVIMVKPEIPNNCVMLDDE